MPVFTLSSYIIVQFNKVINNADNSINTNLLWIAIFVNADFNNQFKEKQDFTIINSLKIQNQFIGNIKSIHKYKKITISSNKNSVDLSLKIRRTVILAWDLQWPLHCTIFPYLTNFSISIHHHYQQHLLLISHTSGINS